MSNAEININGGSFKGDYRDLYVWSKTSKITVSGGAFTFDPTAEGAKLADGYNVVTYGGVKHVVASDATVVYDADTLKAALANGLKVILCVGEVLEEMYREYKKGSPGSQTVLRGYLIVLLAYIFRQMLPVERSLSAIPKEITSFGAELLLITS